ncbi:hypothetical protein MRX96_001503 [Rhipicephalus microplus]
MCLVCATFRRPRDELLGRRDFTPLFKSREPLHGVGPIRGVAQKYVGRATTSHRSLERRFCRNLFAAAL